MIRSGMIRSGILKACTIAVVLVMIAGTLTACGRKGNPEEPPGSTYPREYPG